MIQKDTKAKNEFCLHLQLRREVQGLLNYLNYTRC